MESIANIEARQARRTAETRASVIGLMLSLAAYGAEMPWPSHSSRRSRTKPAATPEQIRRTINRAAARAKNKTAAKSRRKNRSK